MSENKSLKSLFSILLGATLIALTFNCKKSPEKMKADAALLVSASPGLTVERNGQKLVATPGLLLQKGDLLKTGRGIAEIQSRGGSLIRIREYSIIHIDSLLKSDSGSTSAGFTLTRGGIYARTRKKTATQDFQIHTPTAVASVRGTVFSVMVPESDECRIRVFEGEVAMEPAPTSRDSSAGAPEQASKPSVKEAVLLEAGSLGRIRSDHPAIEKTEHLKPTPEEEVEVGTLVLTDEEDLQSAIEAPTPEKRKQTTEKIRVKRKESLNRALEEIQKRMKTEDRDESGIQKKYNRIETLQLKEGKRIRGAVLTQLDELLVVDTPKGIQKIPLDQVEYIDIQ